MFSAFECTEWPEDLAPEIRLSTGITFRISFVRIMPVVLGFQWKLKRQQEKEREVEERERDREREKESWREREMAEKRWRRRETEITGLISRSGCLAMDVDTRHLLERAATAGYQSPGWSRSWPSIQGEFSQKSGWNGTDQKTSNTVHKLPCLLWTYYCEQ